MDDGHELLVPGVKPADLPVVSVISIAALLHPGKQQVTVPPIEGSAKTRQMEVFERDADREMTKDKMRLSLRIAAIHKHRELILGALGCGAFGNPVEDVVDCWLEVLTENEFAGGWWKAIWFAVYDRQGEGNAEKFASLAGLKV